MRYNFLMGPSFFFAGIVGSRRRSTLRDRELVFKIVEGLQQEHPGLVIVSGGADGPDTFATDAAKILGVPYFVFPIKKIGLKTKIDFTRAAYARNQQIALQCSELYCLVHLDRTGGTENTIKHALEAGDRTIYLVDEGGAVYLTEDGHYPQCEPVKRLLGSNSIV
jgi:hypothetical protein